MGLELKFIVEGMDPALFKRIFGKSPAGAVAESGSAEDFSAEVTAAGKYIWTTHPEATASGPCLDCLAYDGEVFEVNDPAAPMPPLHPDCACTMDPYYEEGNPMLEGSSPVAPMERYEAMKEALDDMTPKQLEETVGLRVARLMRLGKVDPADLLTTERGLKSGSEVVGEFGKTFGDLDKMTDAQVRALRRTR